MVSRYLGKSSIGTAVLAAITLASASVGSAEEVSSAALSATSSASQPAAVQDTQSTSAAKPNAQMQRVLDIYAGIAGTPIIKLSPTLARQQFAAEDAAKIEARTTAKAPNQSPVGQLIDGKVIPGPAGSIPIRLYTPPGNGPFPVVVYFHGGGFVVATLDTYDASARALALSSGAMVVSVEYRKAPEAQFPAALDDAMAAYKWVLTHAASINGDPARVAVAGESAGGNLATEICLQALQGAVSMPVYQVLIYPVTDFGTNYASIKTYYNAVPLSTPALSYFAGNYLPHPSDATSTSASPILANLAGMPATTLIAAQIDPLVDEGKAYANKLTAAGVKVNYKLYMGVTHEFFGMGAVLAEAAEAEALAGSDLHKAFAQ